MRVYRIEGFYGQGPYSGISMGSLAWTERKHELPTHPAPHADGIILPSYVSAEYFYGFESLTQLTNWFNREELTNISYYDGFEIKVYELEDRHIIKGKKHVAFIKRYAKLKERIKLPKRSCYGLTVSKNNAA